MTVAVVPPYYRFGLGGVATLHRLGLQPYRVLRLKLTHKVNLQEKAADSRGKVGLLPRGHF